MMEDGALQTQTSELLREYRYWHIGVGVLFFGMGLIIVALGLVGSLLGAASWLVVGAQPGLIGVGWAYAFLGLGYVVPAVFLLRSGWAARTAFPDEPAQILKSLRAQFSAR